MRQTNAKEETKKDSEKIKEMEEELRFSSDKEEIPPGDVVVYNELRSAADLFRLEQKGRLEIKPDYQREFVWDTASQTRFIDSLIKQLPIPSMCFSFDNSSQQWKVVDGLQRLSTIMRFFKEGEDWKLSKLEDINQKISGKTPYEISQKFPDLYSRVENITLPINILRVDYSKKAHTEYMFMVFRRLNESGYRLSNQEIRNAVFQGTFNDFIKNLNNDSEIWKKIVGDSKSDRYKRVELILRFFAFYENNSAYKGKLASFLNDYMFKNRNISQVEIHKKEDIFFNVIDLIGKDPDSIKKFDKASNAVKEAIFFGIAKNIEHLKNKKNINSYLNKLLSTEPFSEGNIREAIMKSEKVQNRLSKAEDILSK